MTEKIKSSPVTSSIFLAFVLTIFWAGATFFVQGLSEQLGTLVLLLISSTINIIFTILAVVLLGLINQVNSFRYVFKTKGLAKGLLVLIPVMAFFLFGLVFNASQAASADIEITWIFPANAFMQATSAFMQNILFRGLLITALLIKFSSTESERVRSVFKASALYLIIYIPLNIVGGSGVELMQLINTFVVGAGFCAAYLYSKNLLSLALAQGVWQILGSVIASFAAENYYNQPSPFALIPLIIILISIVIFTVRFSKRAEPFLVTTE